MTTTDTTLCLTCGKATAGQLTCEGCGVVAPAPALGSDYFALFGLPRKLALDGDDLAARYYVLSRRFHPDLWQDRPPAEREAALRATALVNTAYRTLKDPVRRALYWLSLHGESLGRDNERVPPALAALVFDVQEKLEELRDARRRGEAGSEGAAADGSGQRAVSQGDASGLTNELRGIHEELRGRLRDIGERLEASFGRSDAADGDGDAALAETKTIVSELHYVRTLLRDVERELEPQWSA